MKRFKKVLALVLAGVLALAMLTACDGTTDPDKVIPEDGVSPSVVLQVNNAAANKGWGQAEYSRKYSEVATKLLENWLNYTNDAYKDSPEGPMAKYWAEYNKAIADLGGAKVVLGLTTDHLIPSDNYINPTPFTKFKVDNIVATDNENAFNLADKMGVGVVTTKRNGAETKYVVVCLFDVN